MTTVPDEVHRLLVVREDGRLRFTWQDVTTGPMDYVLLDAAVPTGPYLIAGAAATGAVGPLLDEPADDTYYRAAARYDPGCLGPY